MQGVAYVARLALYHGAGRATARPVAAQHWPMFGTQMPAHLLMKGMQPPTQQLPGPQQSEAASVALRSSALLIWRATGLAWDGKRISVPLDRTGPGRRSVTGRRDCVRLGRTAPAAARKGLQALHAGAGAERAQATHAGRANAADADRRAGGKCSDAAGSFEDVAAGSVDCAGAHGSGMDAMTAANRRSLVGKSHAILLRLLRSVIGLAFSRAYRAYRPHTSRQS